MKRLAFANLYTWSVYSEEKQFDFNGYLWVRPEGNILIDPVAMLPADLAQLDAVGGATLIVLTNRDHEREAAALQQRTGAQIVAHQMEAPLFEVKVDRTVTDGEEIVPDLQSLHLEHGKTPGEMALLWQGGRVAFIGDFLWGVPAGSLALGAEPRLQDPAKAALQVRKLLARPQLDTLLLGDGFPLLTGARTAMLSMLEARTDIYINRINLDELEWQQRISPGHYGFEFKNIDPLIGAKHLGYQVVRLAPGRASFPNHFHHFEEEMFYIMEGTCILKTPRGDVPGRAGDFIACPPGPRSAHKFVNEGDQPCTILMLSKVVPSDVSEYPDSGKINFRAVRRLFQLKDAVDYWHGEV